MFLRGSIKFLGSRLKFRVGQVSGNNNFCLGLTSRVLVDMGTHEKGKVKIKRKEEIYNFKAKQVFNRVTKFTVTLEH
jgi:hypothetical protein